MRSISRPTAVTRGPRGSAVLPNPKTGSGRRPPALWAEMRFSCERKSQICRGRRNNNRTFNYRRFVFRHKAASVVSRAGRTPPLGRPATLVNSGRAPGRPAPKLDIEIIVRLFTHSFFAPGGAVLTKVVPEPAGAHMSAANVAALRPGWLRPARLASARRRNHL